MKILATRLAELLPLGPRVTGMLQAEHNECQLSYSVCNNSTSCSINYYITEACMLSI